MRNIISKFFSFGLGICITTTILSQENFQEGYLLTLKRDTVRGFIDYRNWERNPKSIRFRKILSDESTSYKPTEITSFSVANEHYESAIVRLDKSPHKVEELSYKEEFIYGIDSVFLQTLIEGDKSLYYYKDGAGKDNFLIKQNSEYEVLLYKNYLKHVEEKTIIASNEQYVQQLSEYFNNCPSINPTIYKVRYNTKTLSDVFRNYYKTCQNSSIAFEKKVDKVSSEFGIVGGLAFTNLTFKSESFPYLVKAGYRPTQTPSFGLFYNAILRRNQKKWSLYNELLYTSYKVNGSYIEYENEDKNSQTIISLGYSYLKLNNMLRFKLPVNILTIYLNAGVSNGVALSETNYKKKESKFYTTHSLLEDKAITNSRKYEQAFVVGIGSSMKKYSLDFRFENGNGMSKFSSLNSTTRRLYLLFGFRF